MIIIRVGFASDKAFAASTQQQSTHGSGPSQRSGGSGPFPLGRVQRSDEYEMKPIAIEITKCRETDTGRLSLRDPAMASETDHSQTAKPHADLA